MFIPITQCIIYHYPKARVFCNAKVIEGLEVPEGSLRVLFFRFYSDRVLFRFLDRVFSSVVIDRIFFESSVIASSSVASVIDSSLGPSVLFFRHATIFYQNVLLLLFIKSRCSILYHIFKKNYSFKFLEKNEEILAWYKHEILYWKYLSSIPWIYSS